MTTLLAANLRGALFDGHLFFLDKLRLTPDDLVLGNLVTRQVAADLNRFHLVQRRQQVAISEERARLVRNLHDGLLQSLTGIALQLAETNRLLEENPSAARQYLEEVQRLLVDEQRDLRFMVSDVKTTMFDAVEGDLSLASRLESVRQRTQRQWGLRVELNMRLAESLIPPTLIYEIYYIVHEALVNAARLAQATTVQVELGLQHNQVHITIADDGRGFPFHGHYNLAALTYLQLGPLMMKERVTSLGGRLTLDSNSAGARLDILLPLTSVGGRRENGAPAGEGTGG
jgi:signal transduction histidine kinase